jgi:hypothetical protein
MCIYILDRSFEFYFSKIPFEGHICFGPGARAARGSSLLSKGQGHLMLAVATVVLRHGRAFSGVAAARVVGGVGRRT